MKKGLGWAGSCFVFAALGVVRLQASVIPFHADIQRVQQVFGPDGTLESEQVYTESYWRSSEGSTYRESNTKNTLTGQMENSVKMIENARDKKIYLIDAGKKSVLITPDRFDRKQPYKPPAGGDRKTYLGRTCIVLINAQGQPGDLWVDTELGYPLFERREIPQAGGKKTVRTSRVTSLTVGQEPDPRLFGPLSLDGYKIIDQTVK